MKTAVDALIEKANLATHVHAESFVRCALAFISCRDNNNLLLQVYKNWESSFAILSELYRNIGMAVVAVFIITLIMLSDLRLCIMVLVSIIFTLVSQLEKE